MPSYDEGDESPSGAYEDDEEDEAREPIRNWKRPNGKYNFELDETDPM